jgi:hypothetical protein
MAPKAKYAVITERVSVDVLDYVASSPAAEWTPPGSEIPLRTILYDIRRCTEDGCLLSIWREETEQFKGRRYSGIGDQANRELPSHHRRLIEVGVNHTTIGMSLFALPGYLRDLLRSRVPNLYILDLVNAHPTFTAQRNPTLQHLRAYCDRRDECLRLVMQACGVDRKVAKEVFLRVMYGGGVEAWCSDNGVEYASVPDFVHEYRGDVKQAIAADYLRHRGDYPDVEPTKVIYYVNTKTERECVNRCQEVLIAAMARVQAYEHDGLAFALQVRDLEGLVRRCSDACGHRVTIEPSKTFEKAMEGLVAKTGIQEWAPQNGNWMHHQELIVRACSESNEAHTTFADLVLAEPQISSTVPFAIRDIFVLVEGHHHLSYFDVDERIWKIDSTTASGVLKDYIHTICTRRLQSYSTNQWGRDGTVKQVFLAIDKRRSRYGNGPFLSHVAAIVQPRLRVGQAFEFDPKKSLRYLKFHEACFDSETEQFIDVQPSMCITNSTGWTYEGFHKPGVFDVGGVPMEFPALLERLEAAFIRVRQEHDDVPRGSPYDMSDELKDEFDMLASHIFELRIWFDWVHDWAVVVYELQHMARGVFGVQMAESLILRSAGRGGKDTTLNIMSAVLGTYATSITYDSLCTVRDPDAPSPLIARLRSKRLVGVRECDEHKAMMASVFKRICDPSSKMQGRELYKGPVEFHPTTLPVFCTNHSVKLSKMDKATAARLAIVEYRTEFADSTGGATQMTWRDVDSMIPSMRPGVFWILWRVYRHLLKNRPMRNVHPIPAACFEVRLLNVEDRDMTQSRDTLMKYIEPARGAVEATEAKVVDTLIAHELRILEADARTTLQGLLMKRERTKRMEFGKKVNRELYKFAFPNEGLQWVKLNQAGWDDVNSYK